MPNFRTKLLTPFIICLTLLVTGCGPAKPAAYTEEEIRAVTGRILTAMDASDYAAFTKDFSPEMLSTFSENQFDELRVMIQSTSGNYESAGEMSLANKQGYAIYRIICSYTLEDVVVTIVFKVDGTQVEGLFFDSPNLRTTPQSNT